MAINRSCYNDCSAFLKEHRHGAELGVRNGEVTAGTQVFLMCNVCGIVQTADEVDAGNVWVAAEEAPRDA